METIYRANDGKEFKNYYECENYEWELENPDIKKVKIYDYKGNGIESIYSQESYDKADKVIIPDEYALKCFLIFANFMGFYSYKDIDSPGIWKWNGNNYFEKIVK